MAEESSGPSTLQLEERLAAAREERIEVSEKVRPLVREVKALNNKPPVSVRRAIEAAYILLSFKQWAGMLEEELARWDLTTEWPRIQKSLSREDFVRSVMSLEASDLDALPWVPEFVARRYFPDILEEFMASPHWRSYVDDPAWVRPERPERPLNSTLRATAQAAFKPRLGRQLPPAIAGGSNTARSTFMVGSDRGRRLPAIGAKASMSATTADFGAKASLSATTAGSMFSSPSMSSTMSSTICRCTSQKAELTGSFAIDISAVEFGSHAVKYYVLWAVALLREFFTLQCFRRASEKEKQRAEAEALEKSAREAEAALKAEAAKVEPPPARISRPSSAARLAPMPESGQAQMKLGELLKGRLVTKALPKVPSLKDIRLAPAPIQTEPAAAPERIPAVVSPPGRPRPSCKWASDFSLSCFVGPR